MHLYRPRLPGIRAQAIGVIHTAHALARAGHEVTVLADTSGEGSADQALALLGLEPHPQLDLRISPVGHAAVAGTWFRAQLARWWSGAPGVVLARDKRRLIGALRWLPRRHRIVLETHELDSALARERDEDDSDWRNIEVRALARADALAANCGGTLSAWRDAHGDRLPALQGVAHNGTTPDRQRRHAPTDPAVIRYVGSLRAYKGIETLIAATPHLPAPLELIGGTREERAKVPSNVRCLPPAPYGAVPDLLASAAVLVLPLANNLFGRNLTSPLKLWDYLATSTPIVAADVPSVHEIAGLTGARLHLYTPGEPMALVQAVRAAMNGTPRMPTVRTWDDRVRDLAPLMTVPA